MAKKATNKELTERLNLVTSQLNFCTRMLESVGVAFSTYIKFNDHEEDFKNYLEKNKNLHKLSKEEMDARKSGDIGEAKDVPSKKIQQEGK